MTAVDLPDDVYGIASREARAAGKDVRDWIEVAILAQARGDIPVDDCGFFAPIPEQHTPAEQPAASAVPA